MLKRLEALCTLEGVSGREDAVRDYIAKQVESSTAACETAVDPLGNLLVYVKGEKRAKRRVMFAAHMDEVGLIVTGITDDGYLRFTPVGGIDDAVLFARRVCVNGRIGVIGGKATHQLKKEKKDCLPPAEKQLIDIGVDSREAAEALVQPGDVAVFASGFQRLEGPLFKGRALDDRAGCAVLLSLLDQVPEYDVMLAFTVQEEVGLRGAGVAAERLLPEAAVVVDSTTAADTAGVPKDRQVCTVGGGAVLSFMDKRTLYDRALYDTIRTLAKEKGIRWQPKTVVAGGNDAGAIQLAGEGVRVAAVSLPCRYIHSPAGVMSAEDLEQTRRLLWELIPRLAGGEAL